MMHFYDLNSTALERQSIALKTVSPMGDEDTIITTKSEKNLKTGEK